MATNNRSRKAPAPPSAAAQQVHPQADAQPATMNTEYDWALVRPEAEALAPAALGRPTVPVREAALLGLTVARRILSSSERAEFEKLVAVKLLDGALLTLLPRYAGALLYVRAQLDRAPASSQVLVPASVVTEADEVRTRMLKVLSFYFGPETEVGRKLAKIRQGSGHADLAGDLVALVTLYRDHRARIEGTPEFYRATDEADAARLAGKILEHLSTDDEASTWNSVQLRVYTLFLHAYDEACAAGRYLFRAADDVGERFPSLHSLNAGRAPKAEPKKPADG